MTKRRDIVSRIAKAAKAAGISWYVHHEGGNHTVYSLDGLMIPIARHTEIGEGLTQAIYKECEPRLGKGWWRK